MHKGEEIAIANKFVLSGDVVPELVPVRVLKHGGYMCAFCDTTYRGSCMHTRIIVEQKTDDGEILQGRDEHVPETYMSRDTEENLQSEPRKEAKPISHFPLAPVNCSRVIQVDMSVRPAALQKVPYYIRAPYNSNNCGSPRNEKSRGVWENGIIMPTIGPCSLHVEFFKYSSRTCTALIHSEGREHCLFIHSFTTAATHAYLRRELTGVALGNGTLKSRLRHYHSTFMAAIHSVCCSLPHLAGQLQAYKSYVP